MASGSERRCGSDGGPRAGVGARSFVAAGAFDPPAVTARPPERSSGSPVGEEPESDDGTRWLDEEEQVVWRRFLEAVQALLGTLGAQLERDAGLSHARYEILARLSEADGAAMRMSDLAAAALFSRSRLSHAVARLELAGLVRRESCPTDGRGAIAILTPAGRDRLAEAAPGHVRTVRAQLFDRLSRAQVAELHRICDALCSPGGASGPLASGGLASREDLLAAGSTEAASRPASRFRATVSRRPAPVGTRPGAGGGRTLDPTVAP